MSAFEIIDNIDSLDYKIDREKYIEYDFNDYNMIHAKYGEIYDQIFKIPYNKDEEKYGSHCKALQEINKDVLEYIVKKYNINKEFIDKFYSEIHEYSEISHINNDYIYIFIKNSLFGDLLINKYTMARFIISVKIVENILKANFDWYNKAINNNDDDNSFYKLITFDMFNIHEPSILAGIIDFIFIKHFYRIRYFRQNYVIRRIQAMSSYKFEDQTLCRDDEKEYDDHGQLIDSFKIYCYEQCQPWISYEDYIDLNEEKTKEKFIKYDYLSCYESTTEDLFFNPIFYECNIVDINSDNEEDD